MDVMQSAGLKEYLESSRDLLSSLSPNWPSLERLLGTVGVSYFSRGSMRNTRYYTERITPTRVL